MNKTDAVAIVRCEDYDVEAILIHLRDYMPQAGLTSADVAGKRVVVKPNLLLAYAPEKAATTHPAVMEAVIRLMQEWKAASVIIAESPGGIYNEKTLSHIYGETGMKGVSERTGAPLNYDVGYRPFSLSDGVTAKSVDMINPMHEAGF